MTKHLLVRFGILISLIILAILYGEFGFGNSSHGLGWTMILMVSTLILLTAFSIYLLIESIWFHKKGNTKIRNLNIVIGTFFFVLSFWVVNQFLIKMW